MIIRVASAVIVDIDAIADEYDAGQPGKGRVFVLATDAAVGRIAERPHASAVWHDLPSTEPATRRYVMQRFPYAIAYQVLIDHVWVVAITHTSRRPGHWQR